MGAVEEDVAVDDEVARLEPLEADQRVGPRLRFEEAVGLGIVFIGRRGVEDKARDHELFQGRFSGAGVCT